MDRDGQRPVVRLAAIGDLHVRTHVPETLANDLATIHQGADVLVIAGDITNGGRLIEVERAAEVFRTVSIPIVAVLGNHDRRCLRRTAFRRTLEASGVTLLDGESTMIDVGARIGFAGVAGCGGGFWPLEGPDALPNRAFKAVAVRGRIESARLETALNSLDVDLAVVVMHFAPTTTTLGREPLAKYWMLGNSALGQVIDRHDVDLVIHGHAHLGNPTGTTLGGTPVRNVADSVMGGISIHDLDPFRQRRVGALDGFANRIGA